MRFEDKLKQHKYDQLWQEYCGFIDLDIEEYMQIQNRLMMEQIDLWTKSPLGKKIYKGANLSDVQAFRQSMPLTTYADYADVLLPKRSEMLPAEPVIWIQTTWEGGKHPVKLAPYTGSMLETYKNNVMACFMMATSCGHGHYQIRPGDNMLYTMAPLPYATGLLPLLLNDEITLNYLPSVAEATEMSFSERNKKGFELGMKYGIDLFFGLSSVANFISENISALSSKRHGFSLQKMLKRNPKIIFRMLKASYINKKEGTAIKPKDIFKLKGFVCAGTDSRCYKDALEEMWGVRPREIAAGTEPTCIGTETWACDGLYFFPDACFYEFIPEEEMLKSLDDPAYQPATYLMDELIPNHNYELVVSVLKGGAFMRYRVGDVYRCLGVDKTQSKLPRFAYVDRIPTVIDIGGFTRITEESIESVIKLSGLKIKDWLAAKEYTEERKPYFHMYVEMEEAALENHGISKKILMEHLSIYFRYYDSDYKDLKCLLGIEPLQITILKTGTFAEYRKQAGKKLRRINPSKHDLINLLKIQRQDYGFPYQTTDERMSEDQ